MLSASSGKVIENWVFPSATAIQPSRQCLDIAETLSYFLRAKAIRHFIADYATKRLGRHRGQTVSPPPRPGLESNQHALPCKGSALPVEPPGQSKLARPAGLGPATPGLLIRCSVPLSYGRAFRPALTSGAKLFNRRFRSSVSCHRREQRCPSSQQRLRHFRRRCIDPTKLVLSFLSSRDS
jgi:hypothetical protein